MILYALAHEKNLSDRPLRCRVDLFKIVPTHPNRRGKTTHHSLRDIFDAIFYVLKSGCHWRLSPYDFPPWSSIYYHSRRF